MLTNEDILKIIEAQKKVFPIKQDLAKLMTLEEFDQFKNEIKQDFSNLQEAIQSLTISVDKLVKAVDDLKKEYVMINNQVNRHDKWLHQLAEKLGVKLEY